MSKVSPFSSFRLEDFPDQRDWIGKLFLQLNSVLQEVTGALNGKVSYGDNVTAFTKAISGETLSLPQVFKLETAFTPTEMAVVQATKNGVPITMAGAWSVSGDTITVNELFQISAAGNVPLASGNKFSIVLRFT